MLAGPIDLSAVKKLHTKLLRATVASLDSELERAGQFAEQHVRLYPKFKPRSGNLQAATEHKVIRTRRGGIVRILNRKKYAGAIDLGAKKHPIFARRKPYLVFYWPKLGRWMRLKKVNHPGNRPYKFLYRASNAAARTFEKNMLSQMSRIAGRF